VGNGILSAWIRIWTTEALQNGEIDVGFLRVEPKPDATYDVITKEPIVVILPGTLRWRRGRKSTRNSGLLRQLRRHADPNHCTSTLNDPPAHTLAMLILNSIPPYRQW
jgi:DNA-binding transcriptional LysR family regulator